MGLIRRSAGNVIEGAALGFGLEIGELLAEKAIDHHRKKQIEKKIKRFETEGWKQDLSFLIAFLLTIFVLLFVVGFFAMGGFAAHLYNLGGFLLFGTVSSIPWRTYSRIADRGDALKKVRKQHGIQSEQYLRLLKARRPKVRLGIPGWLTVCVGLVLCLATAHKVDTKASGPDSMSTSPAGVSVVQKSTTTTPQVHSTRRARHR